MKLWLRRKAWVAAFGVLSVTAVEISQGQVVLARDARSDYTIMIDSACSASERHGAEELQNFLEQICGTTLPIARQATQGPAILWAQVRH